MRRGVFVGSAVAAFALRPLSAAAILPADRASKIAMMAVAAGLIELPPAWIVEIIFAAELASEALCDPALCRMVAQYAQLAVPASSGGLVHVDRQSLSAIFSGPVGPSTATLYQRAVDAQTAVAADELAVVETVNRRYTAGKRGDKAAALRQSAQFAALVRRTAADKQRANSAWSALGAHAREAGLRDKRRTSPAQALAEIRAAGSRRRRWPS